MKFVDCKKRIFVAASGAGAGIQNRIWAEPGISNVLVGAVFPYSIDEMDRFLGFKPDSYCSAATAVAMAIQSYYHAFEYGKEPAVGFGLTASVASTEVHRGEHRCHIATMTDDGCNLYKVYLKKDSGEEARIHDGSQCDRAGIEVLKRALDPAECHNTGNNLALQNILKYPSFAKDGTRTHVSLDVVYPGAFNPPHDAHRWIARKTKATFWIDLETPHKGNLTVPQAIQRAKMLKGSDVYFSTGTPLFVDKMKKANYGATIVIGSDTAYRLLDPQWGIDSKTIYETMDSYGSWFTVVTRVTDDLRSYDPYKLPDDFLRRVKDIILPPKELNNLSSSVIRSNLQSQATVSW